MGILGIYIICIYSTLGANTGTNLYKLFGFFLGDLRPDPQKPRGVFQIPVRAEGNLAKIPEEQNPNNMHIFFLLFAKHEYTTTTTNTYHHALLTTF